MSDLPLERSLREQISRARVTGIAEYPEETFAAAQHSFLDWLGCAVAGSTELASNIAQQAFAPSAGEATLIGRGERVVWRDAIVLNGISGHALDFDDMLPAIQGHPSAAVFPALFVLAEASGQTIADVLDAYIAGVEIAAWISRLIMPEHYDAGWHGTATVGIFAATAAVAKLTNLDDRQWRASLDFAATQAAGLRALFGTPVKPFHAGRAAESGAIAARYAAAGAESSGAGLLGERGFIRLYDAGKNSRENLVDSGWAVSGTLYKTYASCYMTQSVIDAAVCIAADIRVDDIAEVCISVSPKLQGVCAIEDPNSANEAKFSLHATAALALLGRDLANEAELAVVAGDDRDYRSLRERVRLEFHPELSGAEARSNVTVTLRGGEIRSEWCDRGIPETNIVQRGEDLTRKAESLASTVIGPTRAQSLTSAAKQTSLSIRDLAEFTRPETLID